jgi:hypothetical protein
MEHVQTLKAQTLIFAYPQSHLKTLEGLPAPLHTPIFEVQTIYNSFYIFRFSVRGRLCGDTEHKCRSRFYRRVKRAFHNREKRSCSHMTTITIPSRRRAAARMPRRPQDHARHLADRLRRVRESVLGDGAGARGPTAIEFVRHCPLPPPRQGRRAARARKEAGEAA